MVNKLEKNYLKVILITFIFGLCVYLSFPNYRNFFTEEDQFVENITALIFLFTFLKSIKFLRKTKDEGKNFLKIISFIALFGFLDEISFGERLFNFNMPFLAGVKIDALHDFVDVAQELSKRFVYANINNIGLIIFLLITLFILLFPLFKKFKKILILKIKKKQIFLSSVMFIIFLILSVIIDVAPFYPKANWLSALEEIFEMYSSMALYTASISIKKYTYINKKE